MNGYSRTHSGSTLGTGILAFLGGVVVWALWGDKISRKVKENQDFQWLKGEIENRAFKVRDLTKEKYDQIVDEVSENYSKIKGITNHELKDVVDDLKTHWHRIKLAWKDDSKHDNDNKPFGNLSN